MLRNYIITAVRNIWRNKLFSLINIVGLALGLACFLLILLYINHESTYDRHFDNSDRLYRISMHGQMPGNNFKTATSGGTLGRFFYEEIPEVEAYTRLYKVNRAVLFSFKEKKIYQDHILYADSNFFDIFNHTFMSGLPANALDEPYEMVLTENIAKRYFGKGNPIGQQITWNNDKKYIVSAVIEDPEPQSHMHFEVLASLVTLEDHPRLKLYVNEITAFIMHNYIKLRSGVKPETIVPKVEALIHKHYGEMEEATGATVKAVLQPVTSIHLHSDLVHELDDNGDAMRVYLFSAIAVLILIIGSINFINLSTAKSSTRALEVGIRKALGSDKRMLIMQFISESLIISLFALFLTFMIIEAVLPLYDSFTGVSLSLDLSDRIMYSMIMLAVSIILGVLSGLYPAFIMASFKPVKALKGKINAGRKIYNLTNIMVILQYSISVFLITSSVIIFLQLNYISNKDLGVDIEDLVIIPLRERNQIADYEVFKGELLNLPDVTDVTSSSAYLGIFEQRRAFLPEGRPRDDMWMLNHIQVDYNYLDVMKARLILGRDFSPTTEADSASIIINKSLVEQLEWKDPLGKYIAIPSMEPENDNRFKIIGVVDDFHFASLHQNVEPLVIMLQPKRINYLMVKTEKEGSHVVDQIEEKWATMFPSAPFDYFFQDTRYKSQYRSDFRMRKTFLLFTVLAIFIASIGIFGLALFTAIRRTREIGVRKVYGSSVMNIVLILSKRLFILIGISCILAFPFAWYYNDEWLKEFAYQITIPFWSFLISGMIAITAGIVTIGLVSLKAARRNPTDVLRYE